jgi:pimeloyl-ACP methyl ester carboxylesterase
MSATTTIDGRPVAYRRVDGGPGQPLLLVHGFTGSKEDFDPVLSRLGETRPVIAVDLPGHMDSPGPDDPAAYGLGALATWLLRLADALDLRDFHLLGHSLGGLVVQRVAAMASQRLHSMILMDTGMGALREEAAEVVTRMAVAARDEGMEAAWEEGQRRPPRVHTPSPNPEREVFSRRRFLALNPAGLIGEARGLIGAAPLGAFLRGIDIPVLVIHGEHDDAWIPSEQALLARTVSGARYVVVPDAVHSPQLENAEYWLKAVTTFLADAENTTADRSRRRPR